MDHSQILRDALAIASRAPVQALSILDRGIELARSAADADAASCLAKHAAVITHGVGQPQRAADYYADALRWTPGDAHLELALACVLRELGKIDEARDHFQRCLELADADAEQDLVAIARDALGQL